jgi:hypothetical protein
MFKWLISKKVDTPKDKDDDKSIDPSEQLLLNQRKLSDLTNKELIELKNSNHIHNALYQEVMKEYIYRLAY